LKRNIKRHTPEFRLEQRAAARRRSAEEKGKGVRWDRLHETRNEYVRWQEFYFWARCGMEVDSGISDHLKAVLDEQLPGFCEHELQCSKAPRKDRRPPWLRLAGWIDEHKFQSAHREGWLEAVTFYAVRDPRYRRALTHYSECAARWKRKRPGAYPSFEQWKQDAEGCDYTRNLQSDISKILKPSMSVPLEQLSGAVERYVEWHGFVWWCRSALAKGLRFAPEVSRALEARCPGFLDQETKLRANPARGKYRCSNRLLAWVEEHFFQDAKCGGWFDAVVLYAADHTRKTRTERYWAHWDYNSNWPGSRYPAYDTWRKEADDFVEAAPN
jgi:hypothetical protein